MSKSKRPSDAELLSGVARGMETETAAERASAARAADAVDRELGPRGVSQNG